MNLFIHFGFGVVTTTGECWWRRWRRAWRCARRRRGRGPRRGGLGGGLGDWLKECKILGCSKLAEGCVRGGPLPPILGSSKLAEGVRGGSPAATGPDQVLPDTTCVVHS